eukprot:1140813-Pelagomonas_calceolata.AAC.1
MPHCKHLGLATCPVEDVFVCVYACVRVCALVLVRACVFACAQSGMWYWQAYLCKHQGLPTCTVEDERAVPISRLPMVHVSVVHHVCMLLPVQAVPSLVVSEAVLQCGSKSHVSAQKT